MTATAANSDADLVSATLAGDREAFGHIVTRYQSLICSLAYSGTGSLPQSEDLAQETFVAAWKQLAHLREPQHLRAWLCGIARNLINNSLRKQVREPSTAGESIDNLADTHSPEPLPLDHTISKEEQAILWRSLEKIPETYREPLILFYREHQSAEAVAEKLEINTDAVHQRLSRGRKLLAGEVASFVEDALSRTNPGQAFTLGVLAALPVTFASSAKVATIAATSAKGGMMATGTALSGASSALLGPAIGLFAGYLGLKMSLKATRTPRQRALVKRYGLAIFIEVILFVAGLSLFLSYAGPLWKSNPRLFIVSGLCIPVIYAVLVFTSTHRFNRAMTKLTAEERQLHPELFQANASTAPMCWEPWEYRSQATLLGLPLVHCRGGRLPGQKAQPAIGWIAYGEKAYGILFASGAVAVGGISTGGISVGLLSFGGLSAGLVAFGGFAIGGVAMGGVGIGVMAAGGFAIAWQAAMGGVVAAHELGLGGVGLANHMNDGVAREFFMRHRWLDISQPATRDWFWTLCFAPVALQLAFMAVWRRKWARRTNQT